MINITRKNDGKQKHHSAEVHINHDDSAPDWNLALQMRAYGADEAESGARMIQALGKLREELGEAIHRLAREEA